MKRSVTWSLLMTVLLMAAASCAVHAAKEDSARLRRMLLRSEEAADRKWAADRLKLEDGKDTLYFLKRILNEEKDARVRSYACDAVVVLAEANVKLAVSILIRAEKDRHPGVREAAAAGLGKLFREGAVLWEGITVERNRLVWFAYYRVFWEEQGLEYVAWIADFDEKIVEELIRVMGSDGSARVRAVAASGLSGAVEEMMKYLGELPERWTTGGDITLKQADEVRKMHRQEAPDSAEDAVDLVEKIISAYKPVLRKEKEPQVRAQVVSGLGAAGAGLNRIEEWSSAANDNVFRSTRASMRSDISSMLTGLAGKGEGAVVERELVLALAALGGRNEARAVVKVLENSADGPVRLLCVEALEDVGGALAADALLKALAGKKTGDELKERMIQSFVKMKVAAAVPALAGIALGDGGLPLRESATTALGELGDARALPLLRRISRLSEVSLRRIALFALAGLGGEEMTGYLALRLKEEEEPEVRVDIVKLIAGLGGRGAGDALLGALGDRDSSVRIAAIGALSGSGLKRHMNAVLHLLSEDGDEAVREAAAGAAGAMGRFAVAGLIGALRDPAAAVRGRAAEELAGAGDCRALAELMRV